MRHDARGPYFQNLEKKSQRARGAINSPRDRYKVFLGLHSEKERPTKWGIQQLDPGKQDRLHGICRLLAVTKL